MSNLNQCPAQAKNEQKNIILEAAIAQIAAMQKLNRHGRIITGKCGNGKTYGKHVYPHGNKILVAIEPKKFVFNYEIYILSGKEGKEYKSFKSVKAAAKFAINYKN
jgi:hypothetical protein